MPSVKLSATLILFLLASLSAVSAQQTCNATTKCGSAAPCCSEFGFCGTDSFCLGGCNPFDSNTLTSCMPEPLCQDSQMTFPDLNRILTNATHFDGNATAHDWIVNSGNVINQDGELALLLTKENGGTRISSTRYVHYGTISATIKTSKWDGIVTAFITMSDIKDEIDWEFPGAKTTEGQSNFFWQGYIPEKRDGATHTGISDTFSNYHEFTIDWQENELRWLIDGKEVRSLKRSDVTSNGISHYPSTPSRVQLSIWPAGIEGSGQGTIDWAGGLINYDDPDYKAAGHFYTMVKSVSIKCADSANRAAGVQSYVYGQNVSAFTPSIALSNLTTVTNDASHDARALSKAALWTGVAAVLLGASLL